MAKKPSKWDTAKVKPHRYSPELEAEFRKMMKAHLAYEFRMFYFSLEMLDKWRIPESYIRKVLDEFFSRHRDGGPGDAVSVMHHVNRIISMWKKKEKPQGPAPSGMITYDD
jgi:hypothetical protein